MLDVKAFGGSPRAGGIECQSLKEHGNVDRTETGHRVPLRGARCSTFMVDRRDDGHAKSVRGIAPAGRLNSCWDDSHPRKRGRGSAPTSEIAEPR